MSDGPHRSLNMPKGWKKLADRADNKAFAADEVSDALPLALVPDWNAEVPAGLVNKVGMILGDSQDSLLSAAREERLKALRSETAGYNLASVFLEYAIQADARGLAGPDAMNEAASNALTDRAARGARQVEEHYFRESTQRRADFVRTRIERGISQSDMAAIAESVLGNSNDNKTGRIGKKTGLDDGVQL